jgi:hypothetical protein
MQYERVKQKGIHNVVGIPHWQGQLEDLGISTVKYQNNYKLNVGYGMN